MIRHVDSHGVSLAVPLCKILYGIAENLPDIEVVFPLETVDVPLAESDEVSLLTVSAQTQQEVLPVLAAARALEAGDELLPDGGVHQLGLARGGKMLTRLQAVGEGDHLVIILVPQNRSILTVPDIINYFNQVFNPLSAIWVDKKLPLALRDIFGDSFDPLPGSPADDPLPLVPDEPLLEPGDVHLANGVLIQELFCHLLALELLIRKTLISQSKHGCSVALL